MTQLIYIVTFKTPSPITTDIYGGTWGAYTSLDKARNQIERWIRDYDEKLLDYNEQANGLHVYTTDKGKWIIEPMLLDD